MLKKKICMVGQFAVGKTSLVRRFVESIYDDRYLTTVGVKIDRKDLTVNATPMTLMLWDLAGEDDLSHVKLSNVRGAAGYILVADGCRSDTLDTASELRHKIEEAYGPLPFVLALNKCDLRDRWQVKPATIASEGWSVFETSAKDGAGVEEMFVALAVMLLEANP